MSGLIILINGIVLPFHRYIFKYHIINLFCPHFTHGLAGIFFKHGFSIGVKKPRISEAI